MPCVCWHCPSAHTLDASGYYWSGYLNLLFKRNRWIGNPFILVRPRGFPRKTRLSSMLIKCNAWCIIGKAKRMLFPRLCVWTSSFAFRNGYNARLQSLHMPVRWSKPNTTSKLAHVPVCWKEANRKFQMFFDFPFQVLPYIPNIQESPIECPLSASDRTNELSSYSVGSATPHNTLVRSSVRRKSKYLPCYYNCHDVVWLLLDCFLTPSPQSF